MGVTRTMHNYPKGRVNCHILLKKSLITRKFPSMITRCVNGVLVKSTSTHGVHICSPLVKRPIWPMVQTEIIVREIFRSSSFSQIQPVKPNMQKSVLRRRNCEVHAIIKIPPVVQWGSTWNILLCRQRTDTTYGLDGKDRARAFQIFFTLPNPTSTVQDTTISNTH